MHLLLAMMVSLLATVTYASESISYSGRLVNSNGSPVSGNVNLTFDLAYSGQLGVNVCTQHLDGIGLVNGVFHVALNFPNCNLTNVLAAIPSGQGISIRVTDRTPDPDRIYSFQAIYSVPSSLISEISKQLAQMSATEGQVLTWDNIDKIWKPRTPAAPSGGTVTSVVGDQGLGSSTSGGNITIGILDEGVTSVKILDGTIIDADIAATAEISQSKIKNLTTDLAAKESSIGTGASTDYLNGTKAWNNFDQSVRNTLLLGYTTGTATPIAATDNVMEAIGKLEGQIIANDTAFENVGQWDKDGTLLFYNSGNVGIGTVTPSDKLEVVGDISVSNKLRFKNSAISYVELKAPVGAGAVTLTLPAALGTNGQVLSTDSSGSLSWLTPTTDSSQITDGSIVDADVSGTANIAQSKIAGLTTDLGSKEPTLTAGTSAQYYRGDKSWQTLNTDAVPEGTKLYFTEPKVLGTDLLGFSSAVGIINAADTVLSSIGKLDGNIAAVSSAQANYVLKAGDSMSGALSMGSNKITGLADPTVATDAANKNYVDTQVSSVTVTPGGADEDIQFNNAGSLGGVSKFKYSSANNSVFLGDKPSGYSNNYIYMNAGTSERSGIQMFTNTSGTAFADGFDIAAVFGYAEINLKEAGYLMLKTSDLERMRITATGNVGINTAAPTEKLDVTGNIALSGKLRLKSDTVNYIELKAPLSLATTRTFTLPNAYGTSGNALITDGAGNLSWGAVATTASSVGGDLSGTIGSAEIVSGAVGSAEIADLSIVNGDIANSTITYGKLNLVDGDVPQAKVNGLVTALSGKEPTITNPNDTTKYWRGDKTWQTLNTSVVPEGSRLYFLDSRVRSALITGYNLVSTSAIPLADTDDLLTALKKLELQNTATSTTLNNNGQWSKNGTSVYYTAGSVGVNTNAPVNKFNVSADGTTKAVYDANELFQFHGGNSNYGTVSGDNITLGLGVHDFASDSIYAGTNEGAWIGSLSNAPLVLRTNNLERLRISETGAVGIGTISPEYKLHIAGNNVNNLLLLENQSSTVTTYPSLGIDNYQGGTAGHPALGLKNAGGTKAAPTAISGGNNLGTFLAYGHNGTNFVQGARIDITADATFTANSAPTSMRFHTTNANSLAYEERMRITPPGNVGIGTLTPASKLDVKGSISAHGQPFPWRWKAISTGVNFGTSTWVDLTIINMNLPANADVEVRFDGSVFANESGIHCSFRFVVDGVAISDNATYGDHIVMGNTPNWWQAVARSRWIDNMAAGNHVIKVQGSAQPTATAVNACRVDGTDYSRIRTTVMAYPVQ